MSATDVKSRVPWPQDDLDKALLSLAEEYKTLEEKERGIRVADIYNRFILKDFPEVKSIIPVVRKYGNLHSYSDEEIRILAGLLGVVRHSDKSAATLRENVDGIFNRYNTVLYPYIMAKYVTNPNTMIILIEVHIQFPYSLTFASIINAQLSGLVFRGIHDDIPLYAMMKDNLHHGVSVFSPISRIGGAADIWSTKTYAKGYYLNDKKVGIWEYSTNPPTRKYFVDGIEVEGETYYILIKDALLANTSIAADPVGILIAYNPIF